MGRARKLTGGELLSSKLEERGLSQSDLAARLSVATSSVSRWLSGERMPSLEMAFALERELGIPPESWLISRTGTEG